MSKLKNSNNYIESLKSNKKMGTMFMYIGLGLLWALTFGLTKGTGYGGMVYFVFSLVYVMITWATAKFIPNDRDKSLKFFKISFLGYTLFTLLMVIMLKVAVADESQAFSIMNTIFLASSVMIPFGLIIWQAKKWTFLLGIGRTKEETIRHYKDHGNDGMN